MRPPRPVYYDLDHRPITAERAEALLRDGDARRVAFTELEDGSQVSTVFLVLDHDLSGEGPPLLYETMVFGGLAEGLDEEVGGATWRYPTRAEAIANHDQVAAAIRELLRAQSLATPRKEPRERE